MPTLWFSYSFLPHHSFDSEAPIASPYKRTHYLGNHLRAMAAQIGYEFQYVNLDDTTPRTIGKDDIVIGHLWFNDGSFIQQAFDQECRAKFCIQPYTHKMVGDEALPTLFKYFDLADHLFLITGPYWFDTMPDTKFGRWHAKATRIENAVNPDVHIFGKTKWNPPGKRAALCIGYPNPVKGLDLTADLARVSGLRLGHCGHAAPELFEHVPQYTYHGGLQFTPDVIRWLCNQYDFFVTMGRYDANPTSLCETSAWGLMPFCTPTSGYWPGQPFAALQTDNLLFNLTQLETFQYMPEHKLIEWQTSIRDVIIRDFTWERTCSVVWEKMQEWL